VDRGRGGRRSPYKIRSPVLLIEDDDHSARVEVHGPSPSGAPPPHAPFRPIGLSSGPFSTLEPHVRHDLVAMEERNRAGVLP
jgi:hypothetical protein